MMNKKWGRALFVFTITLNLSANALAQCDGGNVFFDPDIFAIAAPGLPLEDFEEGNAAYVTFDGPLNSTSNNAIFSPGDILPGLEINETGDDTNRFELIDSNGDFGMVGDGLTLITGGQDTNGLNVSFNPAVSAFGASFFSESDTVTVVVTTTQDTYEYGGTALGTGTFVGCVSSEPIVSLQIDAPEGGSGNYEGVDNISFGEPQEPEPTYSVEGITSGLTALGLVLQNNGADDLDIFTNGDFFFPTSLTDGSDYAVTVLTNPPGQTCIVGNGSGTIAGANVTDVTVTCSDDPAPTYTVGGTVSGLTGAGLQLQNNGADDLPIAADGGFVFVTPLADASDYAVTVSAQPAGQTCIVGNGSGTIAGANITDVTVTCSDDPAPTYTVGGTVSGLTGAGLQLQNNGTDDLPIAADGGFVFVTPLADASDYAVTVSTQPAGQTCSVSNGSGTIAGANVSDVAVDCVEDVEPPVEPPIEPPVPPPAPAIPIPTIGVWMALLLVLMLGAAGGLAMRRRN